MKRLSLILSLILFVALCASTSFWVLQFMKPAPRKVSAAPALKPVADVESVAGLFGGALAVNTNYQLKGIVLANPAEQSGAIIAVDGKPTQAYRIDAEISPGVKLSEVHAGYILILDNGVSKRVDLPQDFKSQTGIVESPLPRTPAGPNGNPIPPGAGGPANRGPANRHGDNAFATARGTHLRGLQPVPVEANPKPVNDGGDNQVQQNQ